MNSYSIAVYVQVYLISPCAPGATPVIYKTQKSSWISRRSCGIFLSLRKGGFLRKRFPRRERGLDQSSVAVHPRELKFKPA